MAIVLWYKYYCYFNLFCARFKECKRTQGSYLVHDSCNLKIDIYIKHPQINLDRIIMVFQIFFQNEKTCDQYLWILLVFIFVLFYFVSVFELFHTIIIGAKLLWCNFSLRLFISCFKNRNKYSVYYSRSFWFCVVFIWWFLVRWYCLEYNC